MDNVFLALRVVVSLGVVIGAIWFVQRRVTRGGGKKSANRKPISVIARQNLGTKASVAVVEFGGKRFLLGVTEHGISVLDNGVLEPEPVAETQPAPAAEFDKALGKAKTAASKATATPVVLASETEVEAAFAPASSKLAGSILSASTWKQAYVAIRGGR